MFLGTGKVSRGAGMLLHLVNWPALLLQASGTQARRLTARLVAYLPGFRGKHSLQMCVFWGKPVGK